MTAAPSYSYQCPKEFMALFLDFTGRAPSGYPGGTLSKPIGSMLTQIISGSETETVLIVGTNSHVVAYDAKPDAQDGHARRLLTDYRTSIYNGFYEITAISHIGPALMYLSQIKAKQPDTSLATEISALHDHITAAQALNDKPLDDQHWLMQLNASLKAAGDPVTWQGKDSAGVDIPTQIRDLVRYGCALALAYIAWVQEDESRLADMDSLNSRFLKATDTTANIGYDSVMVGTFVLDGLASTVAVSEALSVLSADDWTHAKIVLQNLPGATDASGLNRGNLSAGLNPYTNWFHPLFVALAGKAGADPTTVASRIVIAPYATLMNDTPDTLSKDLWAYYSGAAWGQLYYSGLVAAASMPDAVMSMAFPDSYTVTKQGVATIDDLSSKDPTLVTGADAHWPGDYFADSPPHYGGTVDAFMARMKHSFSQSTEMLSNAVAYWAGPAYVANGGVDGLYLPGLTGIDYANASLPS
ncbi:MAG: DUF5624 domain-containing protein [Myxococcota bacterium]